MRQLSSQWAAVLDRVQHALQQAETAAVERETALEASPLVAPAAARETAWQRCLGRLRERREGLEACVEKAQRYADQVDAVLGAGEDLIRRWLADCRAAAQKLADQAVTGVQ